ncbi:MAG TPA: Smr/MutS family protein, partial [Polyangiaceae bacterium]|nr:Smr/MutS family protein [Polyangiaceae bacterium]
MSGKKPPESFRDFAKGVEPLPAKTGRVAPARSKGAVVRAPSRSERDLPSGEPGFEMSDDGLRVLGARPGYEQLLRQLARGELPLEGTLDLHGLTTEEAYPELRRFCREERRQRHRAALIIHGKGSRSPGGHGVLREEVPRWLCRAPLADDVLGFASA